jgi:hypothetical protein
MDCLRILVSEEEVEKAVAEYGAVESETVTEEADDIAD